MSSPGCRSLDGWAALLTVTQPGPGLRLQWGLLRVLALAAAGRPGAVARGPPSITILVKGLAPDGSVFLGSSVTERPIAPSTEAARAAYAEAVDRLRAQYDALGPDAPVRLAKRTSNLFRMRETSDAPGLDVSAFAGVLEVDPVARTADVLGMTTYEDLVDATLRHGLMPLVVPELKTITLGGAVTGLGIESTSFRNGCPHESVIDFDVLTGDGRVLTVTTDGPHAELFTGFPNSYGTLGYALRLRIELQPVKPFVELEHYPHHTCRGRGRHDRGGRADR